MGPGAVRLDFASDNTAGICPEVVEAIREANAGTAASYGEDFFTNALGQRVRELFETDCQVFLVFNGTAANALILSQLCRSYHGVVCHRNAHIHTDECGSPEFFTGGSKLITLEGENGKIGLNELQAVLERYRDLHSHKPRVVSLTQSTEAGTVYQTAEVRELSEFAHKRGLLMHMDGARFANAVAALNVSPKEVSWKAGVDAMSFGGIKNGGATAELVVFFRKDLAAEFEYRAKQAGQLASKMRYLAAQWLALLENDLWLGNAGRANASARALAGRLQESCRARIGFPVEANAVFLSLSRAVYERVTARGWRFYNFFEPNLYRLMCSWDTSEKAVTELAKDVVEASAP